MKAIVTLCVVSTQAVTLCLHETSPLYSGEKKDQNKEFSKTCLREGLKKIARLRLAALAIVLFRLQFPFYKYFVIIVLIIFITLIAYIILHNIASCIIVHHA